MKIPNYDVEDDEIPNYDNITDDEIRRIVERLYELYIELKKKCCELIKWKN